MSGTELKLQHEDFLILDEADEQQIVQMDKEIKQAMVYDLKGKKELSYEGLKHITLLMSRNKEPLKIISCKADLKDDVWYAEIVVENGKTEHQTLGASQQPKYMKINKGKENEEIKIDEFARTKAISKAERNAWRKQIPELMLKKYMELILQEQGTSQALKKGSTVVKEYCGCAFTAIQVGGVITTIGLHECLTCHKPISEIRKSEYLKYKEKQSSST